jgi:hypothetical protein
MCCLNAKTKLQNADFVWEMPRYVFVKSVFLCNVMGFMIIKGIYLLM